MLPAVVRELAHMGPIGAVLLGTPIAALTASGAALVLRGPAGRVACAVAGSSFAASILAAWAAVHSGRERFVRAVLDPDPSSMWPSLELARAVLAEHAGGGDRARRALGLGGLAAYTSTRGMADDAAHPLPVDEPVSGSGVDFDTLPVASAEPHDCGDVDGPMLVVSASGAVSVDGTLATDLAALLAAKRSLWLQLHPGRPLDATALVAAPASMPAHLPLQVVAIAHDAGFARVAAARARPVPSVASETLGPIARAPRLCAGTVVEGGTTDAEPWGDRVRAHRALERPPPW